MRRNFVERKAEIRVGVRYLYFLCENETDSIFYIGLTNNPHTRYRAHTYTYGENITMAVFKSITGWDIECAESFVIDMAVRIGYNLKNSLRCLVSPTKTDISIEAFNSFQYCALKRREVLPINGIKHMTQIHT
jgi:predicted GIY-YIG superfamily endonuclease